MITAKLVERINELSHKQKEGTLTPEEKIEQKKLREEYLKGIRSQITTALDSIEIQKSSRHHHHEHNCTCHHCNHEKH